MRRLAPILLSMLLFSQAAFCVPAKRGFRTILQPDGSTFRAVMTGDERAHLLRLEDGCTVVKDSGTGYYCYALFDSDCSVSSSGCKVGGPVSEDIRTGSRSVPAGFFRRDLPPFRSEEDGLYRKSADTDAPGKQSVRVIIVLCQFSDLSFRYTRADIDNMVNKRGNTAYGATGSVLDYFTDQLGQWYDFTFDVTDIVTLSKGYKYYGEDDRDSQDKHPEEAVEEACALVDGKVDFSIYDKIYVIYAGGGTADGGADDDHIWPHAQSGLNMVFDGKKFTSYSMSSELMSLDGTTENLTLDGIGTICHEFSHTLGLNDYYDTDYEKSGGSADAMYISTALMDGGSYNNGGHTPPGYNAVDYWDLGIGGVSMKAGTNILMPMRSGGDYIIVESPETDGELFLLECRDNSSWDAYIGGKGLLVYHIDRSTRSAGYSELYSRNLTARQRWTYNEVNCRPDHECAKLIPASRVILSENHPTDISGIFFGSSVKSLPSEDWTFWSALPSPYSLSSIRRSSQDGSISLVATDVGSAISMTLGTVDAFQDAAIIKWSAEGSDRPMTVRCDGKVYEVTPYATGLYSVTIDALDPSTSYSAVIECMNTRVECSFTTKPYYPDLPPYIYLGGVQKTISGYFKSGSALPLRLFNAPSAEVEWYWGSKLITPGRDGYYTVIRSGELRAVLHHEDGSIETIYKYVSVK